MCLFLAFELLKFRFYESYSDCLGKNMTSIILFLSIEKVLQVWGRRTKGESGSDERKRLLGLKSRVPLKGLLGSQRPHTPQTVLEQVVFAQ